MKMFIDKFYRLHLPYYSKIQTTTTNTQYRSSINDWDALNYKIVNVKDGVEQNDASNLGHTLTREGFHFVQGKNKYVFIEESKKMVNGMDEIKYSKILKMVLNQMMLCVLVNLSM